MNWSPNEWVRGLNPGGTTKNSEENGYLVHLSSENVVWSTIRVDPVMTEQFKSCLLGNVSTNTKEIAYVRYLAHQKIARLIASPRYMPFL